MLEDHNNKNNVITITACVDPSCSGWLIDTFSGKYRIRCIDFKHNVNNQNQNQIKNAGGLEPHHNQSQHQKANPNANKE